MKEKRIAVVLCRQKRAQKANALITACPHLQGAVRNESVQGAGEGQLVDILLIGWW